MTTDAMIGHSSIFELGRGNLNNDFDEIAGITKITPAKITRDAVDATNMKSPSRFKEYIGGLRDGGQFSLELDFVPGSTSETHILNAVMDDDVRPVRITFPNNARWKAAALILSYEPAAPLDGKMTATVTGQISGVPVFA